VLADDGDDVLDAREKTNWGPMRLTWLTGRHRSTCWKVLRRHGVWRQRRSRPRESSRRYEWAEAGALFAHRRDRAAEARPAPALGARRPLRAAQDRGAGKVDVIGVIDDHSRLAYCEIHAGETAATSRPRSGAPWFREQGCGAVQAVMSDNAKCYATSQLRDTRVQLGARHIFIPPRTPR